MTSYVVVREYARLTTSQVSRPTLDFAQISQTAFEWLCRMAAKFRSDGARLLQIEGRVSVQLDNFVGVLESPCGQIIEILPKHVDANEIDVNREYGKARRLLRRLICSALDLPVRETAEADLQRFDAPLPEWVICQFLNAVARLTKRGVRSDYVHVEEQQRYLRGQLHVGRQLRLPVQQQHLFEICHSVFDPNRPENRVITTCLHLALRYTRQRNNWRTARELVDTFRDIPISRDPEQDLKKWRSDRLMAHYQPVKPWCELILNRHLPLAVRGESRGISLLFPMERLFEQHVYTVLKRQLYPDARLTAQSCLRSLCIHQSKPLFALRPDMLLSQRGRHWVLDAKWKRLDSTDTQNKYGLSQADFYQLFAYGHYYQEGSGEMLLIFPAWRGFLAPLPSFEFHGGLKVWAIPFDLERDKLLLPDELEIPIGTTGHRAAWVYV
ncbi:restriction endonuclease [Burkholderia multivorans]|uniref:McrC family protein n=1 Tax=Burkholderia multivorans TaxID=87883 RepID=UPI000CFFA69F|nr:McrC family protein [Burkholderia multivorans]PRE93283.1 restriction endonuclease [Burkholderia multivorans]